MIRGTLPVAIRILRGLRGDRRTLGLVVVVPVFIIYLFSEVFARPEPVTPILLGVFVFFLTYILTAIGFLRERTAGTLERVLVSPISRSGFVLGYVLGYGVLAAIQSVILLTSAIVFLETSFANGLALFVLVELLGAFSALGIGVVLSLFARTEFQAIQFIPLVISPQVILGGTFTPVETLPVYLEWPARAMPITYLIDAMEYVILDGGSQTDFVTALGVLALMSIATIGLATLTIR
ncbi:ABC transporter permease protein [Halorhabdus tiamatea SARL4B]|uniref:ABC transporter permease protein n=1 Tax=Halorhabdus tiamatea SARL4B TaxID=1033806 RepID=F7PP10_9EURY|nr:ABC transporter permease [Halorhabdus tiamatea]ERJ07202.1 ABC transporter permease protein [Halorhabdus tiamatea SARL4B]CCQ32821.1 ABC-2-type transporter, permease protein [Halorhabdus tiamatea SARL4B]